jgi:hypothetical protein
MIPLLYMTKIAYSICLLFAVIGIMVSGCKKHSNPIPIGISAKIVFTGVNQSYVANSYSAQWDTAKSGAILGDSILGIFAYSNTNGVNGDYLGLTVLFKDNKSKYDLSKGEGNIIYTFFSGVSVGYSSTSGFITITSISNNRIQGYFNCDFGADVTMTNGQFNVPLQ